MSFHILFSIESSISYHSRKKYECNLEEYGGLRKSALNIAQSLLQVFRESTGSYFSAEHNIEWTRLS
jgi:hypothetical protein